MAQRRVPEETGGGGPTSQEAKKGRAGAMLFPYTAPTSPLAPLNGSYQAGNTPSVDWFVEKWFAASAYFTVTKSFTQGVFVDLLGVKPAGNVMVSAVEVDGVEHSVPKNWATDTFVAEEKALPVRKYSPTVRVKGYNYSSYSYSIKMGPAIPDTVATIDGSIVYPPGYGGRSVVSPF